MTNGSAAPLLDSALDHWAATTPSGAAVRFAGRAHSYSELAAASDAIAGRLAQRGVAQGARVGILARKSFAAIAAVFGVLKAGAAYVPIDPFAPPARVAAIFDSCDLAFVLVGDMEGDALPKETPVLAIDEALAFEGAPPRIARQPDDLAYILFTSGSTGVPKGICHTHRSGLAYARMAADLCGLGPLDRVSHHTPLHFDMSIFDVFATVVAGACCVVIPEVHAKFPASLSALVANEGITVWYSVPFAIAQLVSHGALRSRDLSKLRVVMFAGEVMPPKVIAGFAAHLGHCAFINAYGPTETNHCTSARLGKADLDGTTALPIGQVEAGMTAHVDETGELWVAGAQVMHGYWNAPERTAAVLQRRQHDGVMRPFYRTGDIVTQDQSGTLRLIGRADRQIKLRGYRVELDEVELVLGRMSGVAEVAVVVERDGTTLRAVFAGGVAPEDLLQHAAAYLPAYAVPAHATKVAALARTSTGKIDRRAVSEVDHDRSAA